jgi:hypothetical protein
MPKNSTELVFVLFLLLNPPENRAELAYLLFESLETPENLAELVFVLFLLHNPLEVRRTKSPA